MLEDVKDFIQEIESMLKKINLILFEYFFESQSPAIYAKIKEFLAEIKDRISNLKESIKK